MDYRSLQPQLTNAPEIRDILKEIEVPYILADGREVRTLLAYLPWDTGKICHHEFFKAIKAGILSNFVFSCSEVEKKLGVKGANSAELLFEKSIRKLSKHTAQGELGELILFTLLDVYFQAPKLLSKVSFKTSRRMPVYGADAVHAQFVDGNLHVYLGESKLHKNFKQAATKAAESIKTAKDKYKEEFDLLDTFIDFPNIDEEFETKLLEILNPFSENDITDSIHSPCFIGFSEPEKISQCTSEKDFIAMYKKMAEVYIQDFFEKVEAQGLTIDETALLMLPFSSIESLVSEFIAHMGIKK